MDCAVVTAVVGRAREVIVARKERRGIGEQGWEGGFEGDEGAGQAW